jgi:tetratricopeptide (TPR) repeat protein
VAVFYSEGGDIARATQLYIQLVETTHRLGERFGEAIALSNLGYNYVLLGLYAPALKALNDSMQLAESIGARHQSAFTRLNLGLALLRHGSVEKARGELENAITEVETMGDNFGLAAGCTYLGLTLEATGDPGSAHQFYKNAERIFIESGVRGYANDARIGLARCLLSLGQLDEANQLANRAWAELKAHGAKGTEFPILLYESCADIFKEMGEVEKTNQAIKAGYTELMERANKISNPNWRKSYLENVPEHKAVIESWEKFSPLDTFQQIKGDKNGSRKEI